MEIMYLGSNATAYYRVLSSQVLCFRGCPPANPPKFERIRQFSTLFLLIAFITNNIVTQLKPKINIYWIRLIAFMLNNFWQIPNSE